MLQPILPSMADQALVHPSAAGSSSEVGSLWVSAAGGAQSQQSFLTPQAALVPFPPDHTRQILLLLPLWSQVLAEQPAHQVLPIL